uniref:RNA-directed DNA polymerase, eukaryota, reverse transcriptase zinc-binding domain protein n=1 Tax=Tanacetum cinerariifolium TaxID=118510 RepID=A0A6L2NA74_TANCI|nr:RNA-directed DNA polymerase, eukaryota, reverse transcriptase zinc-binding domain protein [Tanacetum cinerariifolium]
MVVLSVDQSFIYGVSADVDMSYSPKSGNGLEFVAAMLVIPNGRSKKIKPFRYANYVADKPEFLDIVNNGMNVFAMFRLVKTLTIMKTHMNKLNWKHGNLFESVKQLKEDLKMAQKEVDGYPYGVVIKANEVSLLEKYIEVVEDEEKLLFQMEKVKWLSKGDKNSRYFHIVVKRRKGMNKVLAYVLSREIARTPKKFTQYAVLTSLNTAY